MKFKLPSRGKWIADRAAKYRADGLMPLKAIQEAALDWDEGRKIQSTVNQPRESSE